MLCGKKRLNTLASFKRDTGDLHWCEGDFSEEQLKMVETSQQRDDVMVPSHFLGNVFWGEGFKPVYTGNKHRVPSVTTSTNSGSLFTIDSILAPRPKPTSSSQNPPVFQHPSIHLGHLAAAAASSGFGAAPADFLGKLICSKIYFHIKLMI